jgi:hypothetical protein
MEIRTIVAQELKMTTALEEDARGQGLRTFFRKIRHKIEKDPARPRLLRPSLAWATA